MRESNFEMVQRVREMVMEPGFSGIGPRRKRAIQYVLERLEAPCRGCEELKKQLAESERARKIAVKCVYLDTIEYGVNATRESPDKHVAEWLEVGEKLLVASGDIAPREEA